MGCLNTKPKVRTQTVVVHSCDYHSESHSHSNGIIRVLKQRSQSPSRYSPTAVTKIVPATTGKDDPSKFVRQKPVARAKKSPSPKPSPHITLPCTPEGERSTLQVMDAEDLEPAEYNPTPEPDSGTKTRLSNEKSEATVSKVKLKPNGPSSVATTKTQTSKQSLESSQDTLQVEELDSDLDDFSRISPTKSLNRTPTPAQTTPLLARRKQKQDKDNDSLNMIKEADDLKIKDDKVKQTKIKAFKSPKEKKKKKTKVKLERVKDISNEDLRDLKWAEHNKETGEIKLHVGQTKLEEYLGETETKIGDERKGERKLKSDVKSEFTETKDEKQERQKQNVMKANDLGKTKQEKQIVNETIKSQEDNEKQISDKVIKSQEDIGDTNNETRLFEKSEHARKNEIDIRVVCEAFEKKGGISLEYRDTLRRDIPNVPRADPKPRQPSDTKTAELRVASPLPKDLYQKELERVRLNRKRKRRIQRRNPDDTPRVPKPGDSEAMGYLGSNVIFRNKPKSVSDAASKATDLSSTENLSEFGSESHVSIVSDLSSVDKSNEQLPDGLIYTSKDLAGDVDLYSLDSLEERNTKFFTDKKNSLILADLPQQNEIPSGSSTSEMNTKQKLLYSKFERRPHSESVLRLAGRPPLPPDNSNANRPVSEKVRRAQAYSRYFTPELDL